MDYLDRVKKEMEVGEDLLKVIPNLQGLTEEQKAVLLRFTNEGIVMRGFQVKKSESDASIVNLGSGRK